MAAKNIFDRAKSILLTPRSEMARYRRGARYLGGLYTKYIVIMAAIPAVVAFHLGLADWRLGSGPWVLSGRRSSRTEPRHYQLRGGAGRNFHRGARS